MFKNMELFNQKVDSDRDIPINLQNSGKGDLLLQLGMCGESQQKGRKYLTN